MFYPSSYSYSHDTPADFGVTPDKANSASLAVSGYWIDGNDDSVEVDGVATGLLNEGGRQGNWWIWSSDTISETVFDIADVFVSWKAGDLLDYLVCALKLL